MKSPSAAVVDGEHQDQSTGQTFFDYTTTGIWGEIYLNNNNNHKMRVNCIWNDIKGENSRKYA